MHGRRMDACKFGALSQPIALMGFDDILVARWIPIKLEGQILFEGSICDLMCAAGVTHRKEGQATKATREPRIARRGADAFGRWLCTESSSSKNLLWR